MKRFLFILLFMAVAACTRDPAYAQTADQVIPGVLLPAPQTNCPIGYCFVPYSSTNPMATVPSGNQAVSCDATITTGGTAQNICGGTVPVNGFDIYNPDASEACWVSDSTTAAANASGSIYVAALGKYETPQGYKPIGVVSIVCATTGHKLTIRRT